MIETGHKISARFMIPRVMRKSAAHIAEAVFPVPISEKQNAFWLFTKNSAVVFWCSNGLYFPGQL